MEKEKDIESLQDEVAELEAQGEGAKRRGRLTKGSRWDCKLYLEQLQNAVMDINSNILKAVNTVWADVDFMA
ncbi:hypothetical protein R1flu_008586 [Riccia fluitans]|uniref:Uncharacterized protein n=1 Tax=Riccia fluitans TaxID=41844 RepID=A0ABD1YC47_9MARC